MLHQTGGRGNTTSFLSRTKPLAQLALREYNFRDLTPPTNIGPFANFHSHAQLTGLSRPALTGKISLIKYMTAPFDTGVAVFPMAHDKPSSTKPSSTNQIVATGPVPGGARPLDDRRSHISSTRYESRPVTRPPEQLHLHPALHEIGWHDAIGDLNQAALSSARFIAVEPVLTTTAGIILSRFGRWRLALFEGRLAVIQDARALDGSGHRPCFRFHRARKDRHDSGRRRRHRRHSL